MPHQYRFRKGWQNEHLAKFILSKFSFVAEPSTISDDLGSDFFCTLFNVENKKSLLPRNSFAIQIKSKEDMESKRNKFEITNKRDYLNGLEIPFFVGVVDKQELKLVIYSGEYISNYFSLLPFREKAFVHLISERDNPLNMFEVDDKCIKFPKIIEIKADYDYISNPEAIEGLFSICKLIQENISSKVSHEYLFKRFNSDWVDIYAGNTSVIHFRDNFLKRLAEVFYNLLWLYRANPLSDQIIKKEFKIYKNLYLSLLEREGSLPGYLTSRFDELNSLTEEK